MATAAKSIRSCVTSARKPCSSEMSALGRKCNAVCSVSGWKKRVATVNNTTKTLTSLKAHSSKNSIVESFSRVACDPRVWQTAVAAQVLLAGSAHAEAGKLFDFDLTLPIMAGQLLLLMKFLDSKLFTPVGNVIDERSKGVKAITAAIAEKQEMRNASVAENQEMLERGRYEADLYVKSVKEQKMKEVEALVETQKKDIESEVAKSVTAVKTKLSLAEKKLHEEKPQVVAAILERLLGPESETTTPESPEAEIAPEPVKEPATVEA